MQNWIIFVIQLIGLTLFKQGYLLQRLDIPTINNQTFTAPKFKKTCMIMIDALRFDFMKSQEINGFEIPHYMNKLNILDEKLKKEPRNTLLFRGMSDPPTTTLQRLMAIVTGSIPTLVDAGSNFHSSLLKQDNIISHLQAQNKSITILGDDTWSRLFPHSLSNDSVLMESFDVWDLHTVDRQVMRYLYPLLELNEYDLLVAHFLGVDHAGHRYGPGHVAMGDKLVEMNQVLERVFDLVDEDTLVIVMGDHGMDTRGDHGGDSFDEMNAGLFFYSKKPLMPVHGQKVLETIVEQISSFGSDYDVFTKMNGDRTIQQIDLVPTWAYLLGLPIPYGNLGSIIPEFTLDSPKEMLHVLKTNVDQVKNYLDDYSSKRKDAKVYFAKHIDEYDTCIKLLQDTDGNTEKGLVDIYVGCSKYLRNVLRTARHIWTRFETTLMIMGIVLLLFGSILAVLGLFIEISVRWYGIVVGLVGIWSPIVKMVYGTKEQTLTVTWEDEVLFFATFGVCLSTLLFGMKVSSKWTRPNLSIPSVLLFVTWIASMGSDSFIIFGDAVLLHFVQFLHSIQLPKSPKLILLSMVLVRLSSLITICRQDQGPFCVSSFYSSPTSSTSSALSIGYCLVLYITVFYLHKKQSKPIPVLLIWIWSYWCIDTFHQFIPTPIETVLKAVVLTLFWLQWLLFTLETGQWWWVLFLLQKPMGQVALLILYLYIHAIEKVKDDGWKPIVVFFVGQFTFYTTGHQYILASIQYDVGFIGLMNANYILSPIFVILNTVGGPLLAAIQSNSKIMVTAWSITMTAATYFAFHFNRHSQSFRVWGPFFFFTALQYIAVMAYTILSKIKSHSR